MFNFERELAGQFTRLVATDTVRQSTEEHQRDIFESHRHRTFALAFYMTGNEIEAEEILSNTFIRAFGQNEQPDAFAIDSALLKELEERFFFERDAPASTGPRESGAYKLGDRNVRRTDLEAAVQSLPPRERFLFLLRDVEGYPSGKISELLQIPGPEVERSLFSARLRLRQALVALAPRNSEAA